MVSTNLILFFKVAKNEILQETKEIHSIMLNKGFLIDSFSPNEGFWGSDPAGSGGRKSGSGKRKRNQG